LIEEDTMATVEDVMTTDLCALPAGSTLVQAAREMRDRDIGDVLVIDDDGYLAGIVTDRDIAVRAVAEGRDPSGVSVDEICTSEVLITTSPADEVAAAAEVMRQAAVRRLPVVDAGKVVGMVTLGDLAIQADPSSALADISQDPPNN
jgi:CBS domain-containing protein